MSVARIIHKKVYHYCSLDTFFAIFSNSTIRLSNISKSNDTEEITYLFPKIIYNRMTDKKRRLAFLNVFCYNQVRKGNYLVSALRM